MSLEWILVEVEHLDSGERSRGTYEVPVTVDPEESLAQAKRLVASRHPQARFERFGADGPTFAEGRCRIVVRPLAAIDAEGVTAPKQDRLFAA